MVFLSFCLIQKNTKTCLPAGRARMKDIQRFRSVAMANYCVKYIQHLRFEVLAIIQNTQPWK